jgi:polar amino acid transport system substrate-binding protein
LKAQGLRRMLRWLSALACVAAYAAPAQAAQCIKTVRWYDDVPYSFKDPKGEIRGFSADLVHEVLKRMGCATQFVEMPWARALLELEVGRLDLLPGALRKPERERFAWFSRPINRSPNVLFVHKKAAAIYSINKLSDLIGTNFRLGAQIGVTYGPEFEALSNNPEFMVRLTPLSLRKSAWKMMEVGRLDGIIADEVTALTELQEMGLSKEISKTSVVVSAEPAMVAISKQSVSEDFVKAFDRSLGSMLSDGKYREILERYVPCTTSVEALGCK